MMEICCAFFRPGPLVPAARSCIVLQALGCPVALCACCEVATLRVELGRYEPPLNRSSWLWAALAALLVACGGESMSSPAPAPAPSSSSAAACTSFPWMVTPAELDSGQGGGFEWCAGRMYPQTVYVGCAEPPLPSCAWAENSGRPDAWCCW